MTVSLGSSLYDNKAVFGGVQGVFFTMYVHSYSKCGLGRESAPVFCDVLNTHKYVKL